MTSAPEWNANSEVSSDRSRSERASGSVRSQTKLEELITGTAFEQVGVPRDAAPRARAQRTSVSNTRR